MESEKNFLYVMSAVCVGLWGYAAALLWFHKEEPEHSGEAQDMTEDMAQDINEASQPQQEPQEENNTDERVKAEAVIVEEKIDDSNTVYTFTHEPKKITKKKVKVSKVRKLKGTKNKTHDKKNIEPSFVEQYYNAFQTWIEDHDI